VTPEEVFDYIRSHLALLWTNHARAITPERVASQIERRFSPNDPCANALHYISPPAEYTLVSRIEIGAASVIAQLRASNDWGAVAAEQFLGAAPVTEMGKLEHAFFAQQRTASHG
jgi:hypothetical protein